MARAGWGRHVKVVTEASDDPNYPVGVSEWNDSFHKGAGIFGFTAQTLAGHATTVVPNRSVVVLSGSTQTGLFGLGDSEQYDVIWVFTSGSVALTNRTTTPNADGQIVGLDTNASTITLSTTIPKIFIRRTVGSVDAWFEYGGGTASNLTLANFDATKIITQSEGIANNDNETTLPTSAAVKDFVDAQITLEDLDATTDSGTIDIDLSSETLSVVGGEGIDTSAAGTTITVVGEDATSSNKGIASFASGEFTLSSGAVAINAIAEAKVTGLTTALGTKAPLASPTFSGTVQIPNYSNVESTLDGIATNATAIALRAPLANPTFTGTLTAATLDISVDVDVDGTLETDALTIDGTALAEYISDTVGNMVTSNTESGIAVAYQDSDNTLDFTVGTLNQNTTGTAAGLSTALISSSGGTGLTSFTAGDILYYVSGTTLTKLPKPNTPAGEVLTFATSATAPSWAAAGGGEILHDFTDFDLKNAAAIAAHVSGGADAPITGTDAYTYVREIDSNNDGFFIKIKKNNGTFTEVQIA